MALRAFRLGHQSLWTDEIVTFRSSAGTLYWVLTQRTVNSNIPPLYYAIVHFDLRLGGSEAILRLPSLVAGIATLVVMYFVVARMADARSALASTALMSISPFHVWYSQEARPYALLLFLSLLALWTLRRLLERPASVPRSIAFVLSAASTFYCHTLGLPFIGFLTAVAFASSPRRQWVRWVVVFGTIGVLLVPGVYRLLVFAPTASADANRTFGLSAIPYSFWAFATGYSIGPTVAELHLPTRAASVVRYAPIIAPIALIFASLLIIGVTTFWQRSRNNFWIVALWFLFPLAFAVAGTLVTRHPFNVRYIILALPPFLVLIAQGAISLSTARRRGATAITLAAISIYSLMGYFFEPRYAREDNRAAGAVFSRLARPNDLVIADAPYTADNLQYYSHVPGITFAGYPGGQPADQAQGGLLRGGTADSAPAAAPDTTLLTSLARDRQRIWLFISRSYHGAPADDLIAYCSHHYRLTASFSTENDVRLLLYEGPLGRR
jgi:4-amino-4-deoxy-L-arabinose transferase-like glycosyltransferase